MIGPPCRADRDGAREIQPDRHILLYGREIILLYNGAMTDLEKLIRREGIQIAITPGTQADASTPPHANMTTWTVTLLYQKRRYVTPFFTMHGAGPLAADVVWNLCQEVRGLDGTNGSFEKWALKHNYNPDSRTAEFMWKTVMTMTPKFKAFLGIKQKEFLLTKHREP